MGKSVYTFPFIIVWLSFILYIGVKDKRMKTQNKNQEERFEKVVKWKGLHKTEGGISDFFSTWMIMIFCSLIYPILYIFISREVYWRKIK